MSTKIISTNAIRGAIESNYCLELFITEKTRQKDLIALAKKKNVKVSEVSKEKMDQLFGTNHQGVCAHCRHSAPFGLLRHLHR